MCSFQPSKVAGEAFHLHCHNRKQHKVGCQQRATDSMLVRYGSAVMLSQRFNRREKSSMCTIDINNTNLSSFAKDALYLRGFICFPILSIQALNHQVVAKTVVCLLSLEDLVVNSLLEVLHCHAVMLQCRSRSL